MRQHANFASVLPFCLLLGHCGDAGSTAHDGAAARIQTQLASASAANAASVAKFRAGAAVANGLESLKYAVTSIMICESLEVQGSAFHNPRGCVELYRHEDAELQYELDGDWTPLADVARRRQQGFVDLLDPSSRSQLASSTLLTHEHARSYHYGVITWALPIKVKATLAMTDGTWLYTHDGTTQFETIGVDGYRSYFTRPAVSLADAPAEEAVVLLPNGGNWFKFQSPFTISATDIDERRAFVLDLVFNPNGIVKGFTESFAQGNLSERDAAGRHLRDITVPMLDLVPVPHRASEQVMRESYQGTLALDGNSFDLRVELYYVEGDATGTIYGVDVKTLVNPDTTSVPPELAKVSYLERSADGTLSFSAHRRVPILTGLRRVSGDSGTTPLAVVCATHADRAAAEGGAAIVVDRCPSPVIDVTLALTARTPVQGGVPAGQGAGPDAGADSDAEAGTPPAL